MICCPHLLHCHLSLLLLKAYYAPRPHLDSLSRPSGCAKNWIGSLADQERPSRVNLAFLLRRKSLSPSSRARTPRQRHAHLPCRCRCPYPLPTVRFELRHNVTMGTTPGELVQRVSHKGGLRPFDPRLRNAALGVGDERPPSSPDSSQPKNDRGSVKPKAS